MKTYTCIIKSLGKNDILVFGSNTEGRHGKGSALFAKQKCGAIYGQSKGLQGNSYAIVTKDLTKFEHPSISKDYIIEQIGELYNFALKNPELNFWVPYTGTQQNLNSYSNTEMAAMFAYFKIPNNFYFEETFAQLIYKILKLI